MRLFGAKHPGHEAGGLSPCSRQTPLCTSGIPIGRRRPLRSNTFRRILINSVPGGIKTELKAQRLLSIHVPLPRLDVQQRIVAAIAEGGGKLAAILSLGEASRQRAAALLASVLGRIAGTLRCDGLLGDVLLSKPRNGWSARCDGAEGGTPVLSLSAVTHFEYQESAYKRTSLETSSGAQYWLRKGDLLMSRSNTPELVGHAAIYNGRPGPCIYPNLMMKPEVDQERAGVRFVWY